MDAQPPLSPVTNQPAVKNEVLVGAMIVRCVVAVFGIAALTIVMFAVFGAQLRTMTNDAALIELSGRQRMLLNRTALVVQQLKVTSTSKEQRRLQSKLKRLSEQMRSAHRILRDGDPERDLAKPPAPVLAVYYSSPHNLDRRTQDYLQHLDILHDLETIPAEHPSVQAVDQAAYGEDLLQGLDAVAETHKSISQENVEFLTWLQWGALGLMLAFLLATGLFVLRPMIQRVAAETKKLQIANEALADNAQQLKSSLTALNEAKLKEEQRFQTMLSVMDDLRRERARLDEEVQNRRRAEQETQRYAAELERSNRELDQFAYSASHDLKAPLRSIDNLAQFIVEDAGHLLPPETRNDLELMQQRVQRMNRLLDDLLAYSRVGRVEHRVETVAVAELVADVSELLGVPETFHVVLGDLPNIQTARAPLEQVFRNLIGNAYKHHDRDGGRVEITAREDDAFIEFTVTDDGPGIAAEYHERIFEMFQTLKPRDEIEGSGMGLALVKKIVQTQGGNIIMTSTPGHGTTFQFTWPKSP